jgi:1,4-alpha-glucan branching enzyme
VDNVQKVDLVGTFNNWKPVAMEKAADGSFFCYVNLQKGSYEYKFIVNGINWCYNKYNSLAIDRFNNVNNVVIVDSDIYEHENMVG